MQFVELSQAEFSDFSNHYINRNFWQSVEMSALKKWNGWNCSFVGVKHKDTILCAVMLSYRTIFMKGTQVQASRGFLIDYANQELYDFFDKNLKVYLHKLKCIHFRMDPYIPYKERDENGELIEHGFDNSYIVKLLTDSGYTHSGFLRGNGDNREPNWMFVKNLENTSEAQMMKEFSTQTRRSIQKMIKTGVTVREIEIDDLEVYKQIMDSTAKRRGFSDHDERYYQGLYASFGKSNHLKMVVAELDLLKYKKDLLEEKDNAEKDLSQVIVALQDKENPKKLNRKKLLTEQIDLLDKKLSELPELLKHGNVLSLSAGCFIVYGDEVLYLFGGNYDEYMKFNGSYALQWYMITYALKNGYKYYNFYGISGEFDSKDEGYGVYEFKKGFHGNVVQLIGDFTYYQKPLTYKLYEALRFIKNKVKR